ncbi:UPF0227 protein, putative [Vibrio alginolyticus 40B]|nr:UPF0227 protein, putative [Vibrio alginolyticus 40B]
MIIYLHGFDSTSPGNHEKVLQLQFIDDDVRFINYSTLHPKHDMQHLLKEVSKVIDQSDDPNPLICGVGLGGYWSERIGFLCGIKQVMFNPNLHPEKRWLVESIVQKSTKISQQNVLISSGRKIKLTA